MLHVTALLIFLLNCGFYIKYISARGLSSNLKQKLYSHPTYNDYYTQYLLPLKESYKNKYGGSGTLYYYSQTIDHFNCYNVNTTFEQRYYINDTFWDQENSGPYLFIAGGEGENDGFGSGYGLVTKLAEQLNGLLITIEHRFYGKSRPFGNNNQSSYQEYNNKLGLLQVEQSMADYLEILTYLQTNTTSNYQCTTCPVIVFGGSYPGELAVYLRLKYPFMFDIALGASAPIFYTSNGLVNSYLYYEIVTNATYKINPKCVDLVTLGFEQLQTSTSNDITTKLNLCNNLSSNKENGLYEIEALLFELWADLAMSNYPPSVSPIKSSCISMINNSNNMTDGILAFGKLLEPFWNTKSKCLNLTDTNIIPSGPNGKIHCSDLTGCGNGLDGESWDYQACTLIEPMGSNGMINGNDMFVPNWNWNITWLSNHCNKRFGISINSVLKRQYWMKNSFGLDPNYWNIQTPLYASNIIFSNGMQDGWHAGGQMKNFTNSDTLIAIVMENGAHHSDLKSDSILDTDDVIEARNMEIQLITKWVKEARIARKARTHSTNIRFEA